MPAFSTGDDIMSLKPDGVLFSNGPGDPAALSYIVDTARFIIGKVPVFGICLGHQIIGQAVAVHQIECFQAAQTFALSEGTIPAPETSHAIRVAINEAIRCRETGEAKCILFNFSGHGLCDLGAYDRFYSGELEDYAYPKEKIDAALAELPVVS